MIRKVMTTLVTGLILAAASTQAAVELGVPAQNEAPIHNAARYGSRAQVENLLRADPTVRDIATAYGSTHLHLEALNPDPGPLQALIAAKAPVNARDSDGATPMHMAAYATRTKNAELLLRAGGDPTLKTHIGRDVLSMARKVRADELAGVVSLWLLKGCSAAKPC